MTWCHPSNLLPDKDVTGAEQMKAVCSKEIEAMDYLMKELERWRTVVAIGVIEVILVRARQRGAPWAVIM